MLCICHMPWPSVCLSVCSCLSNSAINNDLGWPWRTLVIWNLSNELALWSWTLAGRFTLNWLLRSCSTAHNVMQKLHKFGIVRSAKSSLQTIELVLSLLWSVGLSDDNWEMCTLTFHLSQRLHLATAVDTQSVCHLSKFISMLSVFMVALCNRADHYIFALWLLSRVAWTTVTHCFMASATDYFNASSRCRMLPLAWSLALVVVTTSHQCCGSCTGCQFVSESSRV